MKKLLVLFLLLLTFLKIGGFVAILGISREVMRKQVFEKIKHKVNISETICIVETTENLKKITWEKENKEFWFDGELYDIVRIEEKNDIKNYYCITDKTEQKIITAMDNLIMSNNGSPINQTSKDILTLIFQPTILYNNLTINLQLKITEIFTKFSPILSFYSSPDNFNLSPPPEVLA